MESQQDEDTSHPNSPTTQPKGKKNVRKRGPTYMISFQQKIDSGRLPPPTIHFDEYGRPTGEEVSTFESFLGMLAKTRVEITLRNWKDYAEPRRELLWKHILKLLTPQKKMKASKPKVEKIYQKNASQIYPRKIGNQRIKASKPKKETVKATSDISFLPCTWDEHMKTTFQKMVTTQKEPMVHVPSDIMRHEFYFFISIDDLKDFMKMKAFNISIPQYWIWVLYDRFELCDKKTYQFFDPAKISSKAHNGKSIVEINNNRIRYVENSIKDDSVECWLAPYNAGVMYRTNKLKVLIL
ncbi:hypothetical protein DM860_012638 [Cuscuta australis]|uniref:Ubiquitin-like protease family profile domain-containing protein n=1 Tax=Cuscuta australis TaxID=267555 RepID=A0A328DCC8_9ASTE|nr:hypothetical protein DM860_012638 [Cuscuta australis]